MSRFAADMSRFTGTEKRDGTRARDTQSGHCPVPNCVPFSPRSVPFAVLRFLARIAGGWRWSLAWWVLRYELTEASVCPLCHGPHALSACKRWRVGT